MWYVNDFYKQNIYFCLQYCKGIQHLVDIAYTSLSRVCGGERGCDFKTTFNTFFELLQKFYLNCSILISNENSVYIYTIIT